MRSSVNRKYSDDDFDDDIDDMLEEGTSSKSSLNIKRNNTLEDSYAKAKTSNTLSVEDLRLLGVVLKFGFFKELADDVILEDLKTEDNGMDVELNYRDPGSKFPADEYMHFPKYIRGDANIVSKAVPSYTQEYLYELIQANKKEFVENEDAKVLANISILEFISFSVMNKVWGLLAEEKVLICDFTEILLRLPTYYSGIVNFIMLAAQRRRIFSVSLKMVPTYDNCFLFTDSSQSIESLQVGINNKDFERHTIALDNVLFDANNYIECYIYNLNQLSRFRRAGKVMRDCKHSVKLLSRPGANKKQDLSNANIMFNLFWRLLGATAALYSDKVKLDLNRASSRTLTEFYELLPKDVKDKTLAVYTAALNLATVTHEFTSDIPTLNLVSFKNSITVFYNLISRYYDSEFRVIYCPFMTKEESNYLVEKELDISFDTGMKSSKKDSNTIIEDADKEYNTPIDVKPETKTKPERLNKKEKTKDKSSMMDELDKDADEEAGYSIIDGLKGIGGRFGAMYANRNHNGELDVKRKHARRKAKDASKKAATGVAKGVASGLKYAMKNPRGIFRLILILTGGFVIFNIALALIKLIGIL